MESFLTQILERKREEVKELRRARSSFDGGRSNTHRPFGKAISVRPSLAVIAEVKRASPSKGVISQDFDPRRIAEKYEGGGASAISVLTDEQFFKGSPWHLINVRKTVSLPVLRKDFIIDPIQVEQTAHINADALLLIVAALSDGQVQELYAASCEFGIEPLVEVHNLAEFERAMDLSPALLGINNRDLETFSVDLRTTLDIAPRVPKEVTVVSESGIFSGTDTVKLAKAGVSAVLVGEALMKAQDPAKVIAELKNIPV